MSVKPHIGVFFCYPNPSIVSLVIYNCMQVEFGAFFSLFKNEQWKIICVWVSVTVAVAYAFDFWANMMPHSYLSILYFIYHRILLWGQLLQFSSRPGCLHLPLVATDQDWSAEWAVVTGCRNGRLPVPRAPERENTGEWLKNWRSLKY